MTTFQDNPFANYGDIVPPMPPRGAPPKLTGPILTRAAARKVYGEIISELRACDDRETLEIYLMTVGEELLQFENELQFLWEGDGEDFAGLDQEIKRAFSSLESEGDVVAYFERGRGTRT